MRLQVTLLPHVLAYTPRIDRRRGAGGGISCAEGDSGPPRDGREPSWARPCEASGALFLSNGGSGGGHETCTLWPPPAPFGYFPVWESTSSARRRTKPPTRNRFLVGGRGKAPFIFPFLRRFRLCGGDQRAFRSPFGNLRPFAASRNLYIKQLPCGRQEKGLPFFFPYHKGFRLCGGDQGAFRSPPGPLRGPSLYAWAKPSTRNRFLAEGKAKAFLAFSRIADRITPKLLPTLSLIRSPCPGLLLNPPISRQ